VTVRAPLRIGIFLFPDVEELDFAGPWEVLASWATFWPQDHVSVFTFAVTDEPVRCRNGLRVLPDRRRDDAGAIDILIVPGGDGTVAYVGQPAFRAWLRRQHDAGVLITSVCDGAVLVADAGLLGGRTATTHHADVDRLRDADPTIMIDTSRRVIDLGDVVTSAGVSAGIDMALHLVARFGSAERAADVAHKMEYAPHTAASGAGA
jgi:transcriptional regulator GlxA family with amidase domain